MIQYPEFIVYNGKIVTMYDYGVNTNTGRTVQAMAVRGDMDSDPLRGEFEFGGEG